MVIDLNGAEVNSFRSELFDLMLNQAPLRVTTWVIITTRLMIIISMTWSISYQYGVFALRLPILFQSIFKSTSNIFWAISTPGRLKVINKPFGCVNILAEGKYFMIKITIAQISVCHDRYSDLNPVILISNAFNNRFDLFLACINPATHGPSAVNNKHAIETLSSKECLSDRFKTVKVFMDLAQSLFKKI